LPSNVHQGSVRPPAIWPANANAAGAGLNPIAID
jgi:hypothetical protein